MAPPKRPLGLGKSAQKKKQKTGEDGTTEVGTSANASELTVELNEEVDADDEVSQLFALWKTFLGAEKDNELVLNGIIHECDRLLRNSQTEKDKYTLDGEFHAIYALALNELAFFHAAEEKDVKPYFDEALERIDLGLSHFKGDPRLLFSKAHIIFNRVPLEYISKMTPESNSEEYPNILEVLDDGLNSYETAQKKAIKAERFELFNQETFRVLDSLDDLLSIIDDFGKKKSADEGMDSEDEEELGFDEDEDSLQLNESHPLKPLGESEKYDIWWRTQTIEFLKNVEKLAQKSEIILKDSSLPIGKLHRDVCRKLGQSYLLEAEEPSAIFTTLEYDSEVEDKEDGINGLQADQARDIAIQLVTEAIQYLEKAEYSDDPKSWADVAEAYVTLGNLHSVDSKEQEDCYSKAEKDFSMQTKPLMATMSIFLTTCCRRATMIYRVFINTFRELKTLHPSSRSPIIGKLDGAYALDIV